MQTTKILVRRYLRRSPKTPEATVRSAVRRLRTMKADGNLKYTCHVELSQQDSQVFPKDGRTFHRRECSITNVEPGDTENEVRAATTLFHESLHERDIAKDGESAITKANEIKAHHETVAFLKDWDTREMDPDVKRQIRGELRDERHSIDVLHKERD